MRTPGPWALRGFQIRSDNGQGAHVGTYQISVSDGLLMAAAPEMVALLEEWQAFTRTVPPLTSQQRQLAKRTEELLARLQVYM